MDYAHTKTDRQILRLEKAIQREYGIAIHEMQATLKKYEEVFAFEDAKKRATLKPKEYIRWRANKIAQNRRLKEMIDILTAEYQQAHLKAQILTYRGMSEAYALNINYAVYAIEAKSLADLSFAVYSKETVDLLLKENPQLLPIPNKVKQAIKAGEFKAWSKKKISLAVTQSILHGESMRGLAKRLRDVAKMEQGADIRNARTAMTCAENMGRQSGYEYAKKKGLKIRKQWLATLDNRTRHEHRILDGQIVDVDDYFKVEGYEIKEPADPEAEGFLVYNCRCTTVAVFDGFETYATDLPLSPKLGDMPYEEWKKAKPVYTPKKKGGKHGRTSKG